MDLERTLIELGLSKYAAQVYPQLLQLGLTNAGPVITATGLHRQFVYTALEELVTAKLATCVVRKGRKHFQATHPRTLVKSLREKEALARAVLPELSSLQRKEEDRLEVYTLFGRESVFDNLRDMVESAARGDRLLRIIGGAPDSMFYDVMGKRYKAYVQLLEKYEVKKHLLAPADGSEEFKRNFAEEKGAVLKTLERGLSSPTYTRITHEMVSIEVYGIEPMVIQIRNRAVAKGYLEHFNLLWSEGRPFKKRAVKGS